MRLTQKRISKATIEDANFLFLVSMQVFDCQNVGVERMGTRG
jgi:hypothetical protein